MTKFAMASTCSSNVGHFDGHGGPPVQNKVHCPIQHVQGYSGSHWMPPSGNYLRRTAPAAGRATANEMTTKTKKCTKETSHFDGHGGAPVRYLAHRLIEEILGFVRCH
jgi:hypothetical protein